jgi:hypothetical protein
MALAGDDHGSSHPIALAGLGAGFAKLARRGVLPPGVVPGRGGLQHGKQWPKPSPGWWRRAAWALSYEPGNHRDDPA